MIVDKIELIPIARIKPNARNARRHNAKQISHLKAIIAQVGFVQPGLVDQDNRLIAGHGRLEAARQLGMKEIPVIRLSHLSPSELKALAIADNRIAELASWDEQALKLEFHDMITEDLSFSIADVTGFDAPAIDALVYGSDFGAKEDPDDAASGFPSAEPLTEAGDVWRADGLALGCLDAMRADSFDLVLKNERARLVLTDPPFNVAIAGHASGNGRVRHREFVQASGEMSETEYADFLTRACGLCKSNVCDGALLYVFMDGAHLFDLMASARAAGLKQKSLITWAKTNAGMGSFYRSQTEFVLLLKAGEGAHANNVQLGRFGRNRTTLWTYPGANAFGRDRDAALSTHPTVKPVAMLRDIILDASAREDLVLDPFAGSGSTLIAAHRSGRRAAGLELDPRYVDLTLDRLAATLSVDLVRDRDGVRWSELKEMAYV